MSCNPHKKQGPLTDIGKIRAMSVIDKVQNLTTLTVTSAAVHTIAATQRGDWRMRPFKDYH
jgi:hypothetical protein